MADILVDTINSLVSEIIRNSDGNDTSEEMSVLKRLIDISILISQEKYGEVADAVYGLHHSQEGELVLNGLGYTSFSSPLVKIAGMCAFRDNRETSNPDSSTEED